MTRVLGGITVACTQFRHIVLGTQDTGDDNLMEWNALYLQRVEISLANILKQHRGTWHKIRNAVVQLIYIEIRVTAHIHQLALAVLSFITVLHRTHTKLIGSKKLHIVLVGKGVAKMRDREYTVFHHLSLGIEKYRRLHLLNRRGVDTVDNSCIGLRHRLVSQGLCHTREDKAHQGKQQSSCRKTFQKLILG